MPVMRRDLAHKFVERVGWLCRTYDDRAILDGHFNGVTFADLGLRGDGLWQPQTETVPPTGNLS